MNINLDNINTHTKAILGDIHKIAVDQNVQIFAVGGFVRDVILNKPCKDIDFVVIGDTIPFINVLSKIYSTSQPVTFPKFGTAMIYYKDHHLEFVSAREEKYYSSSRKPEVKSADLYSDLSRRDFTINTLALDLNPKKPGNIIDPYHGFNDIEKKIIKTPLEADKTFFDDPLRMMRAIRFAVTLDFEIEKDTFDAISRNADRLIIISQERITEEFNKILLSDHPAKGISLLDECKLLEYFLPELVEAKGVDQKQEFHHKDVYYHTLQVVEQISKQTDNLNLRLAALLHDIAKPKTKRFTTETGWTFHGHEVVGEKMTEHILKRMKYSNEIIHFVKKMVRLHLRPMALVSNEVTDSAIRRLLFLSGDDFDNLMILCRADITSKNPQKVKQYLRNYENVIKKAEEVEARDRMRAFKSPVDGNEIMQRFNLDPGPLIGKIKKIIEEAILEGRVSNNHDAVWQFLEKNKDKIFK